MFWYILLTFLVMFGVIVSIGLGVLQYKGYPVLPVLKKIALWTAFLGPIVSLVLLFIISAIRIVGFDVIGWVVGESDVIHPDFMFIYAIAFAVFGVFAAIVGFIIVYTGGENFRAVDAKTGKTGTWTMTDEAFGKLTVEDHDGNEIGIEGLHDIPWYAGGGYEADEYDRETHTATTSWYAGLSPSETRKEKFGVAHVRDALLDAADSSMQADAERDYQTWKDAKQTGNTLIKGHEYATRPDGELENSPMQDHIEGDDDDNKPDDRDVSEVYDSTDVDSSSSGEESADGNNLPTEGGEKE